MKIIVTVKCRQAKDLGSCGSLALFASWTRVSRSGLVFGLRVSRQLQHRAAGWLRVKLNREWVNSRYLEPGDWSKKLRLLNLAFLVVFLTGSNLRHQRWWCWWRVFTSYSNGRIQFASDRLDNTLCVRTKIHTHKEKENQPEIKVFRYPELAGGPVQLHIGVGVYVVLSTLHPSYCIFSEFAKLKSVCFDWFWELRTRKHALWDE